MTVEEDSGTAGYVCNEDPVIVSLTEADRKHYRTLFSSVLVSYDNLKIGDGIGQGMCTTVQLEKLDGSNFLQFHWIIAKVIMHSWLLNI